MKYWIVVGSPDNFQVAVDRGFDLFGFKSTRRKASGEMEPGDKLVFYLTGIKMFGGIATVKSDSFEDHSKLFTSVKKTEEDYPFRVKTKADIVLDEDQMLYVPDFVPLLEFTKKGETKSWAMHFQGNLHKISEADYNLLEKAMKSQKKAKGRAKVQPAGTTAKPKAQTKGKSKPKVRAKARSA